MATSLQLQQIHPRPGFNPIATSTPAQMIRGHFSKQFHRLLALKNEPFVKASFLKFKVHHIIAANAIITAPHNLPNA